MKHTKKKQTKEEYKKAFQDAFQKKLEEITQYYYSDGCVLFWVDNFCIPEEIENLNSGKIADAIVRVFSEIAVETMAHLETKEEK